MGKVVESSKILALAQMAGPGDHTNAEPIAYLGMLCFISFGWDILHSDKKLQGHSDCSELWKSEALSRASLQVQRSPCLKATEQSSCFLLVSVFSSGWGKPWAKSSPDPSRGRVHRQHHAKRNLPATNQKENESFISRKATFKCLGLRKASKRCI